MGACENKHRLRGYWNSLARGHAIHGCPGTLARALSMTSNLLAQTNSASLQRDLSIAHALAIRLLRPTMGRRAPNAANPRR